MKKIGLTIFIICCMMSLSFVYVGADIVEANYEEEAAILNSMGLLKGVNGGYQLDRAPSRLESAVMLIRLLGKEKEALEKNYPHPFTDVPEWAGAYVGYMYEKKLTTGVGSNRFGADNLTDYNVYITFVLRALGYDDKIGDFSWNNALEKAQEILLINDDEISKEKGFLRCHMVHISYNALKIKLKDTDETLLDKLIREGVIEKSEAKDVIPDELKKEKVKMTKLVFKDYNKGIHNIKIDISTLPEEFKAFSKIHVLGLDKPIDDMDAYFTLNSDIQKANRQRALIYNKQEGSYVTVYSGYTLITLFDETNNPIGYGGFADFVKEGEIEVEFKPYKEVYINLNKIEQGIEIDSKGNLIIDIDKIPAAIKSLNTLGLSSASEEEYKSEEKLISAVNSGRNNLLNLDGKSINILETKGSHLKKKYLLVCFYADEENWYYKSFLADDLDKKITDHHVLNRIKEAKKGLTIISPDQESLVVFVDKNKLPEVEFARIYGNSGIDGNGRFIAVYEMLNSKSKPESIDARGIRSSNNMDKVTNVVLLYDKDMNIIYYHIVTKEDVVESRKLFKDAHIEIEPINYKNRISSNDFTVTRLIEGFEDTGFSYDGGTTSTVTNDKGQLIELIIGPFLFEKDGVEYIIEPKLDFIKIKNIIFE
ncbi:hypothetical protein [Lutispora thermophila]|uniref:SLH domain-containing protein n=1 Tax=Lutispora thermophila DSM 19022 TaxID=1122184 RepID=A0A1M6ID45_9FIRM|nr:hypothetical protein [Lutispora thermophila]SHJ32350.1 hypothetical protein SAMN02745176_03196 [Lutispora thermophila DSM 19022]